MAIIVIVQLQLTTSADIGHGSERNDVNKTTHPCFAPEVYAGSSNPAQKRRHQKGAKLAEKSFELAQ
jgi:hypothetical protein